MNSKGIFVMAVTMFLMVSSVTLAIQNARGEQWTQSSDLEFSGGNTHFVQTNDGTLTLDQGLTGIWRSLGEVGGDWFGYSVASAGDVNGDGYDDVIVGAYKNDGGGTDRGEVYLFNGSSSGLDTTVAWVGQGEADTDRYGYSVACAGDVNGDGYADIIVGTPRNNAGGDDKGEAYVYYGSPAGLSTTADWSDQGESNDDYFGECVAGAGDVNGDGYSDVVIAATGNDGGGSSAGEVYLYYGSDTGLSATPDWYAQGDAGDFFGCSVAGAGDVNGDGYSDVIIGAYSNDDGGSGAGEAYVYHGSSTGLTQDADPDWFGQGENENDYFGMSVAGAHDVNGDGYDDVIVGSYGNDDTSSDAGKAYVYHGSSSGLSTNPDWSDKGESDSNYFGRCVAGAGDVNGDGYTDVLISAPFNDEGATYAGKAYLYHGSVTGLVPDYSWSAYGSAASDYLSWSLATAGDVNGDGYSEVIIGAYKNDETASDAGAAYVYAYNQNAVLPSWAQWTGEGDGDNYQFGSSVASAGDVNGDGYGDVIIGASEYNSNQGRTYIYHGSATGLASSPARTLTGEVSGNYFGCSVASAGDVNGDGYGDVIIGADYYDAGYGRAYIYHGSSSGIGASADQTLTGAGAGYNFGYSVASAGDPNNDGYDDVIIGAPGYNSDRGQAYIYYGSSSGISGSVKNTFSGSASDDLFGTSVDGAGDVDGDGYDDVIIGAPSYNSVGRATIYYGTAGNFIEVERYTHIDGEENGDEFARSVAGAGDVNGDGYDDVIIGAYNTGDGNSISNNGGTAYAFHGSASGISPTTDWTKTTPNGACWFGRVVRSANDINGDGYDDVIINAYYEGNNNEGKVYVYHGSSSGLISNYYWSVRGEEDEAFLGGFRSGLAGAGDVNGDGYADMIVSSPRYGTDKGKVYVYHGSGYVRCATFDSAPYNVGDSTWSNDIDWLTVSWNPTMPQPAGTSMKAQIGTSEDASTWIWHGPDGTSSSYYTSPTGQTIYTGDRTEFIRVRLFLESTFGEPGDALGQADVVRTPSVTDFSVEYRLFQKPTVTLNWPNGGENLMHGEDYPVTWTTTGDVAATDPVALYYSLDNGTTWTAITTGTTNDGIHVWTLPSDQDVERALVKVIVSAPDGSTVADTSDRPFSIDPPPGQSGMESDGNRVISPSAGEEIIAGSKVTIQWELTGEEIISLHYSTDFGQNWQIIAENILNLGSYNWQVTDDLESENVVIRASGEEKQANSQIFSIVQTVTSDGIEDVENGSGDGNGIGSMTIIQTFLLVSLIGACAVLLIKYKKMIIR